MYSKEISLTPRYTNPLDANGLELAEGTQPPAIALNAAQSKLAPRVTDSSKRARTSGLGLSSSGPKLPTTWS